MDSIVLVVIVVVLVVVAVVGLMLARRRRSEKLQEHFGSEYERTVTETGDRKAAEATLTDREKRHKELDIRDLRPEERTGYQREWEGVQQGFVDDPAGALRHADTLVMEIMRTRGYPVDDFDRRADDISVAHPDVVHHYREARSVHDASTDGQVDTERQRGALTSYRSLVGALLGTGDGNRHGDHGDHDSRGDHRDGEHDGHDGRREDARHNGQADRHDGTHRADDRRTEEQTR